jgi:hypothetical protein
MRMPRQKLGEAPEAIARRAGLHCDSPSAVPGPLFTFAAYLGAVMEPAPTGTMWKMPPWVVVIADSGLSSGRQKIMG